MSVHGHESFWMCLGSKVQLARVKSGLLEEERGFAGANCGIKARLSVRDRRRDRQGRFTERA